MAIALELDGDAATSDVTAEVDRRVASVLRDYDLVTAGEERHDPAWSAPPLLVLCEGIARAEDVASIARRVTDALRADPPVANARVATTAVGASLGEPGPVNAPRLVVESVTAAQRALDSGIPFSFFDPVHTQSWDAEAHMADRLRLAIEAEELVLHYQPKVELSSRRLVGLEALVRWPDEHGRLIPPDDFIPVAERTGLIEALGAWVLREACAQLAKWRHERSVPAWVFICVNVSAKQFTPRLSSTVQHAIRSAGIEPGSLVLEVTESVVMRDVEAAIETLRSFKEVGVQVAVDDFGTGYSSLAYLKRLPLDELKIDRAFVDGLGQDPEDTAIAGAIVALGHALDLSVIAEGVETELQARSLQSLGCDIAQGYYYARPQSAEDLDTILSPPFVLGTADRAETTRADLVLIADDAADVRQLACVSLTTAGFEVREATDGKDTLKFALEHVPDCVLLDLSMPGLSGIDTCRALRASRETADCAIVILTNHASPEDKIAAFSAGADDYMVKPFSPRELVAHVRTALSRRRGFEAGGLS